MSRAMSEDNRVTLRNKARLRYIDVLVSTVTAQETIVFTTSTMAPVKVPAKLLESSRGDSSLLAMSSVGEVTSSQIPRNIFPERMTIRICTRVPTRPFYPASEPSRFVSSAW